MLRGVFVSLLVIIFISLGVFSLADRQIPATFFGSHEISSPSDWIQENQIQVYPNQIILNIDNATWASFTDTNSMDPFLDAESNAIEIKPSSAEQINVGDVISYRTSYATIIHRVIEKGTDEQGLYFIVKGDNNKLKDPQKVRFEEIKGVVVAIIY